MSNKDKGFASMDKEKVREIASKGGQASHKDNSEEDE
ncbi:MAG: KGG domain-containing protein [Rickettsia endosymbiont of Argas persicus]